MGCHHSSSFPALTIYNELDEVQGVNPLSFLLRGRKRLQRQLLASHYHSVVVSFYQRAENAKEFSTALRSLRTSPEPDIILSRQWD
jgi:hypothetical protein